MCSKCRGVKPLGMFPQHPDSRNCLRCRAYEERGNVKRRVERAEVKARMEEGIVD